jgi:hypothetical protein
MQATITAAWVSPMMVGSSGATAKMPRGSLELRERLEKRLTTYVDRKGYREL